MRPFDGESLRLLKHRLHGSVLKVWRTTVFTKDAFHQDTHAGARGVAVHPVHGNAALDTRDELMCDDAKLGLSHHVPRAVVLGERVVESDLLVRETGIFAPLVRGSRVLGQL
jgi:hypothetical protein